MTRGLALSKSTDCAGSVPRSIGARSARRVMTAPAAITGNVVNAAVPDVDSAGVRFSHIGERPHSKHLVVRTSDGVSLAVCDTGPRTAEHTVVFLHGLCLNQTSWERQITYLLSRYGRSVRVISYDHRGHGRSAAAPMNTYRIDQLADDLAHLLTALDVTGPLTLAGHSMGGMTALAYLARSARHRPVEPTSLVLVATAAGQLANRGLGRLLATPAAKILHGLVQHTPHSMSDAIVRALARPVWPALTRCAGYAAGNGAHAAASAASINATPLPTKVGFLPSLRNYDPS